MLAKDEQTKNLMIECHQKAVEQTLKIIEDEYIQATVKHDCKVNTKNILFKQIIKPMIFADQGEVFIPAVL